MDDEIFFLALIAHGNGVAVSLRSCYHGRAAVKLEMVGTFLVGRLCLEDDCVAFLERLEEAYNTHFSLFATRFLKLMPRLASPRAFSLYHSPCPTLFEYSFFSPYLNLSEK